MVNGNGNVNIEVWGLIIVNLALRLSVESLVDAQFSRHQEEEQQEEQEDHIIFDLSRLHKQDPNPLLALEQQIERALSQRRWEKVYFLGNIFRNYNFDNLVDKSKGKGGGKWSVLLRIAASRT